VLAGAAALNVINSVASTAALLRFSLWRDTSKIYIGAIFTKSIYDGHGSPILSLF